MDQNTINDAFQAQHAAITRETTGALQTDIINLRAQLNVALMIQADQQEQLKGAAEKLAEAEKQVEESGAEVERLKGQHSSDLAEFARIKDVFAGYDRQIEDLTQQVHEVELARSEKKPAS